MKGTDLFKVVGGALPAKPAGATAEDRREGLPRTPVPSADFLERCIQQTPRAGPAAIPSGVKCAQGGVNRHKRHDPDRICDAHARQQPRVHHGLFGMIADPGAVLQPLSKQHAPYNMGLCRSSPPWPQK